MQSGGQKFIFHEYLHIIHNLLVEHLESNYTANEQKYGNYRCEQDQDFDDISFEIYLTVLGIHRVGTTILDILGRCQRWSNVRNSGRDGI